MAERLAFLERLTREQKERLEATSREQQKGDEEEGLLAAAAAAETRTALIPVGTTERPPDQPLELSEKTTMAPYNQASGEIVSPQSKAEARALEYASLSPEEKKQVIKFMDAVGRKFTHPYWISKTWDVS
jgi:hypothetical protein